jgi:hypothetical protein
MKITRALKVTAKEFFDYIEHAIVTDLKHNEIIVEDNNDFKLHSGFNYKKIIRSKNRKNDLAVEVHVDKFEKYRKYKSRFISIQGESTICYEIEEDNGEIVVHYEEEFVKSDKKQTFLEKVFAPKVGKNRKKDLRNRLLVLERDIIRRRSQT